MKFRCLEPHEIECRIGQIAKNGSGLSLLLFKTARTDMDILDETVGPDNWQCKFYEHKGTLFCSTGIRVKREDGSYEWVWKDDAGSPSNMEAAKGEASDCRKRSGVCWGIGRCLYTAPFIWVNADKCNLIPRGNGYTCNDRFRVAKIRIDENPETGCRRITGIRIVNEKTGQIVFSWKE